MSIVVAGIVGFVLGGVVGGAAFGFLGTVIGSMVGTAAGVVLMLPFAVSDDEQPQLPEHTSDGHKAH